MNSSQKTSCKCQHCENKFEITSIELRYYAQSGLPVPEVCRLCKNAVKQEESSPKLFANK